MMDRTLVGLLLGPVGVTVVEVATTIQNGAQAILTSASHGVVPASAWLTERDDKDSQLSLLKLTTMLTILVTMPAVIGTSVLADPLLTLWLGDNTPEGTAAVLPFAMAAAAIASVVHVSSEYLVGTGRGGVVLKWAFYAVVVNLALTPVLLISLGVVGAFIGTLIATPITALPILRNALSDFVLPVREFATSVALRSLAPSLPATVAMIITTWIPQSSAAGTVLIALLVGGFVYVVAAAVMIDWKSIVVEMRSTRPVETAAS